MTWNVDMRFWTIVSLVSLAFLMAFISVGDEPMVAAGEIQSTYPIPDSGVVPGHVAPPVRALVGSD